MTANARLQSDTLRIDSSRFALRNAPTFSVNITPTGSSECELSVDAFKLCLSVSHTSNIVACLDDLNESLLDVIASKIVVADPAQVMLVQPASSGGVWVCLIRGADDRWTATAVESSRPLIDTSYALPNTGEQAQYIAVSYQAFKEFLKTDLFFLEITQTKAQLLRVKVEPRELWFLRFPLGVFAKLSLPGFAHYSGCQWITSDRSISEIAQIQQTTETEIADTTLFFSGARFILNTYRMHSELRDAKWLDSALSLSLEIFRPLREVNVGGKALTLQWILNPDGALLSEILETPQTRFVFAAFDARSGVWQLGDGPHQCYIPCAHAEASSAPAFFDLERLQNRLNHIRLFRVFHCNSIYDPFRNTDDPASRRTLAHKLLATEAYFVEGSVTAEPAAYYFCDLFQLLLTRSDLRTILWAKSLVGLCEPETLIGRANSLLSEQGWVLIE
jgi:hypothetical protein